MVLLGIHLGAEPIYSLSLLSFICTALDIVI